MISYIMFDQAIGAIESLTILAATIVALLEFESWKKQTKWKAKFELAEKSLLLFYQIEDSINRIRNPVVFNNEFPEWKKDQNETPEKASAKANATIVYRRLNREEYNLSQIKILKYQFKTIFGVKSVTPFDEIEEIIKEISKAAHLLENHYWAANPEKMSDIQYKEHLIKMTDYERIIWSKSPGNPDDPIQNKVKIIISKIEEICNEILIRSNRKWLKNIIN